jgi:ubiquinone/menaquinone biosynthesis C-methylase UbiE
MDQSSIFLEGEGDNYFLRNKAALGVRSVASEIAWLGQALSPFKDKVNSVLEIGCSNGAKLEQICRLLDAKGQGIDPSKQAVDEGNHRLSGRGAQLHVGTASRLPFDGLSFDFVYFGFCLYLIDREDLFTALAEADRVLKFGGFLAITDFDPIHRHKRPYHHKDGVFSFKQDYSKVFTESGLYYLVSKNSFSHRQSFFDADGNERVSTTLLFKEVDAY